MAEKQGLYNKFVVFKETGENLEQYKKDVFVLAFDDPHAMPALLAYAASCYDDNPQLAEDLCKRFGHHICHHTEYPDDIECEFCLAYADCPTRGESRGMQNKCDCPKCKDARRAAAFLHFHGVAMDCENYELVMVPVDDDGDYITGEIVKRESE